MYHKWQSYDIWFLRYEVWQTEFFLSFWTAFCTVTPLKTQKIKILEKWKKNPRDIIILHKCIKNFDHMLYYFLDMTHNRSNWYFSFWAILCPCTSLRAQKIKIKKKKKMKKTPGDIIILYKCTKNHDHMLYCSWDMARDECNY